MKQLFTVLSVIGLTALLAFSTGCGGDDNPAAPEPDPVLDVSIGTLDFGTSETEITFSISNSGGGTLEWSISESESWLTVAPSSGSTTGETDRITVTVDRNGQSDGSYSGTITIQPNVGSSETISVEMVVSAPELSVSLSSLDFGSSEEENSFTIANTGGGTLTWTLSVDQNWLTVLPSSGETSAETDQVTVTVDRTGLSAGGYEAEITVTSNVGNESISVSMSVGEMIWSYGFSTNTDLDQKWECFDDNGFSDYDYWGVVDNAHEGAAAVWCNGRGDHPAGRYDDNMDAIMRLRSDEAIDIRSFSDVTIRFWMAYETEQDYDYVRLLIRGNDDVWYYNSESYQWWGGDYTWRQYEMNLSDFNQAPDSFLRIGFFFNSDISNGYRGVYIDDIEVWGIE